MSAPKVTHRLTRHARRVAEGSVIVEGCEPAPFTETTYEATCACGRVFVSPTDLATSAAYLAHLPMPSTLDKHADKAQGGKS